MIVIITIRANKEIKKVKNEPQFYFAHFKLSHIQ